MRVDELGLDEATVAHYREQGIEELYPPQAEAVDAGVMDGEDLVAAVPTASGKTMIAELAMQSAGGRALYVVPLRALASEKRDEFAALPGVDVGISTGDFDDTDEALGSNDVVVATSEKVDSLIRNGVGWIDDVSCCVVDEVHLLDSGDRGPTLEVTLAKLRRLNPEMQVLALSATVANADEIAGWLDAELIESDWRPVDLKKGIHADDTLRFDDGSERALPAEDPAMALVEDVVEGGDADAPEGKQPQCLVFVNSRRSAEAVARRLGERGFGGDAALEREVREAAETETGEDLADAVAGGAAFHHAGLTGEHRGLVEEAFRDGRIKAIAATPTLAAGVNVPARRVVVRDHQRYGDLGMQPLPVLEVHQMFGRAGRPGLDPYGEAVLVAGSGDEDELWERYVEGEPEPVFSKLANRQALRSHVLATVASGFAASREALLDFLDATFYAHQEPGADLGRTVDEVVAFLVEEEMLERIAEDDEPGLRATDLGHQVSRLYVDPLTGAQIVDALEGAAAPDVDDGPLTYLAAVCDTPDMYSLYLGSGEDEAMLQYAMEHETAFVDPPSEFDRGFEDWLASLKTARVLMDWIDEDDREEIAERYDVGPGDIHTRVERSEWLLYAAESLAHVVDVDDAVLEGVRKTHLRVEQGVREELLPLVQVRGIGRVRARRLHEAGIEDRDALRSAEVDRIARLVGPKTAVSILDEVGRDIGEDDVDASGAEAPRDESSQSSIGDF